jgi:hypothetical protein
MRIFIDEEYIGLVYLKYKKVVIEVMIIENKKYGQNMKYP